MRTKERFNQRAERSRRIEKIARALIRDTSSYCPDADVLKALEVAITELEVLVTELQ